MPEFERPRFNLHCMVCNGDVAHPEHFGYGFSWGQPKVGDPVPPDPIVAFAHGDCLRRVASEGHEFASPQPGREWSCFVCGEPKDVSLGTALITECGRAGDRRRGSAPKFFAHGTCARSVAHGDYEFVTVSIPGR